MFGRKGFFFGADEPGAISNLYVDYTLYAVLQTNGLLKRGIFIRILFKSLYTRFKI